MIKFQTILKEIQYISAALPVIYVDPEIGLQTILDGINLFFLENYNEGTYTFGDDDIENMYPEYNMVKKYVIDNNIPYKAGYDSYKNITWKFITINKKYFNFSKAIEKDLTKSD